MGLDSYLFKEEWGDTKFSLSHPLCGGMFSGDGNDGSFRGKVYDGIVRIASSDRLTLYVEEAGPEFVRDVAEELESFLKQHPEQTEFEAGYTVTRQEVESLASLFRQAAEKGCRYAGWW